MCELLPPQWQQLTTEKPISDLRINRICPCVDMRVRWKVCGKLGTNRAGIRWLSLPQAVSPAAQEVTFVLSDAQTPGSVFCWNKFLPSKDNCSFDGYFKTGLDAAR